MPDEPDREASASAVTDFWRDVAKSVTSSLITAYILFVVASVITVGALGGVNAPVRWQPAFSLLVASIVLAGAVAHLAWLCYLLIRQAGLKRTSWLWCLACFGSALGNFLAAGSFPMPLAGLVLALGIGLIGTIFTGAVLTNATPLKPSRSLRYIAWATINSLGALIAVVGVGVWLGVLLARIVESAG
ncbi:hypothetical protein [Pseudactinotalea terrae]|uniref:hypothetical protein n=1 Tax=Pseudactinotalea terrae TaxID=1743262 RepID=UPI0012E2A88A|nr:hypothetical protein [Pseudactinotalea terrae]